jgi:hypothetical protein
MMAHCSYDFGLKLARSVESIEFILRAQEGT